MPSLAATGLYGKIPSHGDFVRVRAADPAVQALVGWLEEGYELARRVNAVLGPEPVRLVFRSRGAARTVVGVLAPSVDKVGRRFPLCVFALAGGTDLAATVPSLPAAVRPFLDAAAALAAAASSLKSPELLERLDALPLPAADAWSGAAEAMGAAAREPARDLLSRLLGDLGAGQQHYAVHCLRTACERAGAREPPRAPAVLDCPATGDPDRWFWLELARRRLRWDVPPAFFWTEGGAPWLLVSAGPPPPATFAQLRPPPRDASKVWPLTTPQPQAIAAARAALGPASAALGAPEGSVMDLLSTLST